jgi:U3 small nucleolar ribonucleoprotein protein IMP3
MAMRKFKYHEQKLLKKVSPYAYKTDSTLRENEMMKRYHIEKREDYHYYNKLCGQIRWEWL